MINSTYLSPVVTGARQGPEENHPIWASRKGRTGHELQQKVKNVSFCRKDQLCDGKCWSVISMGVAALVLVLPKRKYLEFKTSLPTSQPQTSLPCGVVIQRNNSSAVTASCLHFSFF